LLYFTVRLFADIWQRRWTHPGSPERRTWIRIGKKTFGNRLSRNFSLHVAPVKVVPPLTSWFLLEYYTV